MSKINLLSRLKSAIYCVLLTQSNKARNNNDETSSVKYSPTINSKLGSKIQLLRLQLCGSLYPPRRGLY